MNDRSANRLTHLWRSLFALAWVGGFFAYAAVWQASTQLGIGTWWVGPRAQPTSSWIRMLPSAITLGVVVLTAYGVRRLPTIGLAGATLLLIGAVPDFSRSTSLAVAEVVIALALMAASAAAITGLTRPGANEHAAPTPAAASTGWDPPAPDAQVHIGEASSVDR